MSVSAVAVGSFIFGTVLFANEDVTSAERISCCCLEMVDSNSTEDGVSDSKWRLIIRKYTFYEKVFL